MHSESSSPLTADRVGVIILAAGYSKRFQTDKRQALLADKTGILQATLAKIPATFSKKLLVLHPGDEALAQQFEKQWPICFAETAAQGIGNSLAYAIQRLSTEWHGALIGLGDMPWIKPETYSSLQQALCLHSIVSPVHDNKRGNPTGFQAKYFSELANLQGDQGARKLLEKYSSSVYFMACQDAGILKDIDTPAELSQQQNQQRKG